MREKKKQNLKIFERWGTQGHQWNSIGSRRRNKKAEPTHVSGFRIFVLLGVLGWAKKLVSFSFVKYEKDNNGVLMRRSKK